tara:strand:- start:1473 stop:2231 length:759 start_codon:yes stop_codon:yes gene_type:complete
MTAVGNLANANDFNLLSQKYQPKEELNIVELLCLIGKMRVLVESRGYTNKHKICDEIGISSKMFYKIFFKTKLTLMPKIVAMNIENVLEMYNTNDSKGYFSKKQLESFWDFIYIITHNKRSTSPDDLVDPFTFLQLINIANKYSRTNLDLFHRIFWHYINRFQITLFKRSVTDDLNSHIATIILQGQRLFFKELNRIQKLDNNFVSNMILLKNDFKPTAQFDKLFLKFDTNCVPAVFRGTKTFPWDFLINNI